MKAKDTLLLNNTISQNPILMRRAWFWHVASQMYNVPPKNTEFQTVSLTGVTLILFLTYIREVLSFLSLFRSFHWSKTHPHKSITDAALP